jgi:nickel/cobalt transporter (NicO) family protein
MKIRIIGFALFFIILCSLPIQKAAAHPADVYANTIYVTFSQSGLQVKWEIKPGPMLTSYLWYEADVDQDGILSQEETDTWGRARAALLTATLDNEPLSLRIESVQMPTDLNKFQAGEEFITFTLSSGFPAKPGSIQHLVLNNGLEAKTSINWFHLSAIEDTAFFFPAQKNNAISIDLVQDRAQAGDQSKLITAWDSGAPSLPAGQTKDAVTETAGQIVPELAKRTPQQILLDLVRTKDFSVSFYAFALGISLALGALHALTPGHGKTIVAAYLVGSRGTAWHAVVLGSVVTLTHTGSVFLLGIITLAASQYILPTRIIPALEIVSGLMIIFLGSTLLVQRLREWQVKRRRDGLLRSSPAEIDMEDGKKRLVINQPIRDMEPSHGHDGNIPRRPQIGNPLAALSWRSLITLGISGGLVPCPDAIAILLVAIAINRIFLGLALIISFSIGLAVILIVIGLLMVNGGRLFARMDFLNRLAPFMPVASALIVLLLGFGLTYGAVTRLGIGFTSSQAESGVGMDTLQQAPDVIYLNDDENKHKQVFIVNIKAGDPRQLTDAAKGVTEFALSPDQSQMIYIEQTVDFDYAMWLMKLDGADNQLMFSCRGANCGQPVWSPDGKHIVYEYMPLDEGTSSLWWLDLGSGKAQPLFQEARLPGTNPRWSPNGAWLSYAAPEGIRLDHLESGESRLIPNMLGAAVQWASDSKSMLVRDVIIKNNQFITQLYLYDLSSKTLTNINANESMENILAAWSPDGKLIAVVRRDLAIPRGDQIWLMRTDGSEAHVITDMPAVLHGSLNWSPDGKYILYDLYLLDSFPLESELEMVNVQTGEVNNLGVIGYNPKWLWNTSRQ